jgi:5-methyltetrahydrofolate--homocysteine methyltransferase
VPPTPHPLLFIGERCNVTGSKRFLNLIHDNNFDDALGIARQQLDAGAHILDLNFDDPLLKPSPDACLQRFINLLNNEPDLANLPLMIDSSHFDRIIPALKLIQGRPIVNSISLKDGQDTFLQQADTIRQLGAVPLVIAFDESGQADSFQRKIDIAHRAYNLLTQQLHYPPQDIIFDPCLLAIATGIPEHNTYALDFIQATAWIKQHLPLAKVSAGLSNLSFAFRGNNPLRRAIHSVFLHLAHPAGLDFAIADPAAITPYDSIDPNLTQLITSLIRDDDPQALDRLTDLAHSIRSTTTFHVPNALPDPPQNPHADPAQRLQFNLIHGLTHSLPQDIDLALKAFPNPIDIINGPLMDAMTAVGKAFGKGEMFLPQVIKTARTMKAAVALLQPALNEANASTGDNAAPHSGGTVLFATVKGDVHDIGKNIVSIILACNNFNVVDLGVMVHANTIVAKAIELHPDVICLSGLISPSLAEMADVASALQAAGLKIPLILGGAATSKLHTALVIDPLYDAPVIHVRDAALAPQVISQVINKLLTPGHPNTFLQQLYDEYNELRANHIPPTFIPLTQARQLAPPVDFVNYSPKPEPHSGVQLRKFHVSHVIPLINWTYFFHAWKVKKDSAQAIQLQQDAQALLDQFARSPIARCRAIHTTLAANSIDGEDTILIYRSTVSHKPLHIPLLRQQTPDANGFCKSLADYVLPQSSGRKDVITFFLVSVQLPPIPYHLLNDDYHNLLHHSLADRLAEATAEYLHTLILPDEPRGIRPAIGFPSLPDLSLMMILDDILLFRAINVERSQNGAMKPKPSIAGIYITHPEAHYFSIPHIDTDQLADYILRRKLIPSRTRKFLTALLTHASKY